MFGEDMSSCSGDADGSSIIQFQLFAAWIILVHAVTLRSGDRILVGVRFSAPVQTSPEAHPASCTMGTGSFPGVRCGQGVTLTPF